MNFFSIFFRNQDLNNLFFHLIFFTTISLQTVISSQYINFFYILGLFIFIRADYKYSLGLIFMLLIYGFYQDSLLNLPFGFSSMIFLYFLFLGQISSVILGIHSNLSQIYIYIIGLLFYSLFEFLYIFFKYNFLLKLDFIAINLLSSFILFLFFTKLINFILGKNEK